MKQWMEWGIFGEFYFQAKPDITFYVSCHGGSNIYIIILIYILLYVYIYINQLPRYHRICKSSIPQANLPTMILGLRICSHSMLNLFLIIWSLPSKPLHISTIRHMVNRILSIVFWLQLYSKYLFSNSIPGMPGEAKVSVPYSMIAGKLIYINT